MASIDRACRRAREDFDVYLDGEAPPRRVHAIEQHLAVCDDCRRLLAQRRRELAAISDLPAHTAPEDFTQRVMAGLADRPTPTARPAARLRPRLAYAAAAAAVAALGIWLWAALHAPDAGSPVRAPEIVRDQPAPSRPAPEIVVEEPDGAPEGRPVVRGDTPERPRNGRHQPKPRGDERPAPEPEPPDEAEPAEPIAVADLRDAGLQYEREGMWEQALEVYELAAAEDESPLTTVAVGRVHDRMGDTVSAIETYAEAAFADFDLIPYEEGSET